MGLSRRQESPGLDDQLDEDVDLWLQQFHIVDKGEGCIKQW